MKTSRLATTIPNPEERLYQLLPAIYRIRDAVEGESLRALLAILQQELQVIEADIDDLYDNWFIETCSDWVVPYIGDLLAVQELYGGGNNIAVYGQQERRAYVANTLAYRRRKGTTPVLEQLVQDVTGWRARAVEFGQLLLTSQNLEHLRTDSTTFNLRANDALEQIGTPFEQQAAYSVEVRSPQQGGRYNIPNLGLYIWRLQSYPMVRSQARAVSAQTPYSYTFNPLGYDSIPLFNQPQTKNQIVTLSQEINVPAKLRSPVLANELKQLEASSQEASSSGARYFDRDPVLQIFVNGRPLPPEHLLIQSLVRPSTENSEDKTNWRNPGDIVWEDPAHGLATKLVAVDPEQGRLVFRENVASQSVEVSYSYGFSGDIGGGPYGRLETSLPAELAPTCLPISPWHWQIQQSNSSHPNPLAVAVDTWNRIVSVRAGLRQKTHIPLAIVEVPAVRVIKRTPEKAAPIFKPGVVKQGLQVYRGVNSTEVVVTPGIAIDREGRRLSVAYPLALDVTAPFTGETFIPPEDPVVLVVQYQPSELGDKGPEQAIAFKFLPENTLGQYPTGLFIPLARFQFAPDGQLCGEPDMAIRPSFHEGVVYGLELRRCPGTLEAHLTAGCAVDKEGNVLLLTQNQWIDLVPFQGQTRTLILVPSSPKRASAVQLLTQTELNNLDVPYLQQAILEIPQVKISHSIATQAERIGRHPELKLAGLGIDSAGAQLSVASGSVKTLAGEVLNLETGLQIDLSLYAGRTLLLFLSSEINQGLPLRFTSDSAMQGDSPLGLIPVQPITTTDDTDPLKLDAVDTGWIVVRDNATYLGHLSIALPAMSQLNLVAADGYRPHIVGNISAQGWFSHQQLLGCLNINGFLIEGKLAVLPGSLGKLWLKHCTLVPSQGGLSVQAEQQDDNVDESENWLSLFAIITYWLSYIWQLIGRDLGLKTNASSMTMTKLLKSAWEQFTVAILEFKPLCFSTSNDILTKSFLQSSYRDNFDSSNSQLKIILQQTISGPISLDENVASLSLKDCIVGKDVVDSTSARSIAAPRTATELSNTTVLGRTLANSLKASNCLFAEKVTVLRHQVGCARFSYVPDASHTPSRYQCQPDLLLRENLDQIPTGITSLSSITGAQSPNTTPSWIFAATEEEGIWQYLSETSDGSSQQGWQNITGDLNEQSITAVSAYRWPRSGTADASQDWQENLLVGTMSGQVFRRFNNSFETPTDGINQKNNTDSFDWRPIALPSGNAAITQLHVDVGLGQGYIELPPDAGSSGDDGVIQLNGTETQFSSEIMSGDMISIVEIDANKQAHQPIKYLETFRVNQLGRSLNDDSEGNILSISSRGRRISGSSREIHYNIKVGDTLTVERVIQTPEGHKFLSQTRTIVALVSNSDLDFIVDDAFNPPLNKAHNIRINIDSELTLNNEASISDSLKSSRVKFVIHRLWVATKGNGLWRGNIDASQWKNFSKGLTHSSVTTIVRDAEENQSLWLGTMGGGVFRLIKSSSECYWVAMNQGLTCKDVRVLLSHTNCLLVGTSKGLFRFNYADEIWENVKQGPTDFDITVLTAVTSPSDDLSQSQPDSSLSGNSLFLFAGSRDGKLFGSEDKGVSWKTLDFDLLGTDITAFATDEQHNLWLGSAIGEVFKSQVSELGKNWISIHQGRTNLEEKIRILNELKPSFTSLIYGDPGYAQLTQACAKEIRIGSEDKTEMGAFNALKQSQKEANLIASLDDNLRFGLDAGIFYMT